ncbi:hypothetical protein T492DRAFT_1145582 [Pavlovales sp. CCMP2436]|nr:hypothetical protein T492DRAFT_1145582 [Pavlovales sp. CCMP2436]
MGTAHLITNNPFSQTFLQADTETLIDPASISFETLLGAGAFGQSLNLTESRIYPASFSNETLLNAEAFGQVWRAKWDPKIPLKADTQREVLIASGEGRVAVKRLKLGEYVWGVGGGGGREILIASGEGRVAVKRLKLVVDPTKTGDTPRIGAGTPRLFDADAVGPEPKLMARELVDFCNELLTLRALSHPHVIGYIGCTLHPNELGEDQLK